MRETVKGGFFEGKSQILPYTVHSPTSAAGTTFTAPFTSTSWRKETLLASWVREDTSVTGLSEMLSVASKYPKKTGWRCY